MKPNPGRLPGLFREILSSGGLPTYMLSAVIPSEQKLFLLKSFYDAPGGTNLFYYNPPRLFD